PVRLEIFHQHFASIAEEMGVALERSAVSTNVRERLDFSCAIFDPAGGLVANAPHIPVHLGAMGECVRQVAGQLGSISPGDVIVSNDPFLGGSHLPDVTVITPVFEPGGELLFYTANRAHHAEIGGIRPGSMPPGSKNLAEEGVLIRCFKVIDGGLSRFAELSELLRSGPWPSRSPRENVADIEAQVAANKAGAGRLVELIASCGRETVLGYMGHIQAAARRLMESQIERLDPGQKEFEDELDDGTRIVLKLERRGRGVRLDFTGTSAVLDNNFNATPAIVSSAALYCFRCLVESDIPLNAGVLDPLEVVLPECFLNPPAASDPAECAAVSAGNVETSQRIVDVIFGALGTVAASQGTMNNLLFGNEDFGYYETIAGGAGAGAGFAGADGVHTHMTNTRITDPEVLERRYPVRLHRFCLRRDSGGRGENRGGDGVVRELEFLAGVEVSILSQRRSRGPYGMAGGEAGEPGRNLLRRAGEDGWTELPAVTTFSTRAGDRLRIETPGGGGWGRPSGQA
ncbi:MAG: hydantoinase B/oxoprolinase family protein, partial [Planctomycetota bacterium]|nr:hydantoinase B/oxoprolinase family protein [Planctomycetota bacterium]